MKKFYFLSLFLLITSFLSAQSIPYLDYYPDGNTPIIQQQNANVDVMTTLTWTDMAPSTHAVSRSCCVYITIGGSDFIYQFGGGSGAQYTTVAKYDVTANTWTTTGLAAIPVAMSSASAVAIGSKIYLFGGESAAGLGKTYMYDPVANTWTAKANMLTAVTDATVLKFNDQYVYLIGGGDGLFGTVVRNSVQLYDVTTDTYTACTNLPAATSMMGGGLLGNTIIVGSGWNGTTGTAVMYKGVIGTPMTSITWTTIAAYPGTGTTRMASGPIVLNNSYPTAAGVFFTGGAIAGSTVTGNTYFYNICSNAWETLTPALAPVRSNMKLAFNGFNIAYVVAGYTGTAGIGNVSKATFAAIAGNCYSLVPVELISFEASTNGNSISLNWKTATEINNKGFEVQRKMGDEFKAVAFLDGHGTTTQTQTYSFNDNDLAVGSYSYRLKQMDYNGAYEYSEVVNVEINAPAVFALDQNYPNPFNPSTKINFSLAADSKVNLTVYNLLGQAVAVIAEGLLTAGSYSYNFDASKLSTGVYFYQLDAQGTNGTNFKTIKKMMLTK